MKKTTGMLTLSLLVSGTIGLTGEAKTNSFEEVILDQNEIASLKETQEGVYYFYRLEDRTLTEEQARELTGDQFDLNDHDMTIQAVGYYEENGVIYSDLFIDDLESLDKDYVKENAERSFENLQETEISSLDGSIQETVVRTTNYTARDSYNDDRIMGYFTSNVTAEKVGTASGSDVWDVRYFNEIEPTNSYQTRALTTQSSSNGSIQSYGPTENTGSGSTVSVGLSGLVPSVSWSFSTLNSSITNQSSTSSGYAQWKSDVPLGTSGSQNTFVTEPGVRYTSDSAFRIFDEYTIHMYRNLSAEDIKSLSVSRYIE